MLFGEVATGLLAGNVVADAMNTNRPYAARRRTVEAPPPSPEMAEIIAENTIPQRLRIFLMNLVNDGDISPFAEIANEFPPGTAGRRRMQAILTQELDSAGNDLLRYRDRLKAEAPDLDFRTSGEKNYEDFKATTDAEFKEMMENNASLEKLTATVVASWNRLDLLSEIDKKFPDQRDVINKSIIAALDEKRAKPKASGDQWLFNGNTADYATVLVALKDRPGLLEQAKPETISDVLSVLSEKHNFDHFKEYGLELATAIQAVPTLSSVVEEEMGTNFPKPHIPLLRRIFPRLAPKAS